MQSAQREVAAIMKKNQEKELRDRLAREEAERERCRKLAKETREKIDAENQRKLEAERQMVVNLKEMKAAQYEADLAAQRRRDRMQALKANQARKLQETAWADVMAWDAFAKEQETQAKHDAMRLFSEQRETQAYLRSREGTRAFKTALKQQRTEHEHEAEAAAAGTRRAAGASGGRRSGGARSERAARRRDKPPSERSTRPAGRSPRAKSSRKGTASTARSKSDGGGDWEKRDSWLSWNFGHYGNFLSTPAGAGNPAG